MHGSKEKETRVKKELFKMKKISSEKILFVKEYID